MAKVIVDDAVSVDVADAVEEDAAVERIREIVVGGQLDALTGRLDLLGKQLRRETERTRDEIETRLSSHQKLVETQMMRVSEQCQACRDTVETFEESLRRVYADLGDRMSAVEARLKERDLANEAPVSAAAREAMIRDAAYFRGLQRAVVGEDPRQDWVEAEREVDRAIAEKGSATGRQDDPESNRR